MTTRRRSKEVQPAPDVKVIGTEAGHVWEALIGQCCWIVARKFQFQCFSYVAKSGRGTHSKADCIQAVPSTAFVTQDHLTQLLVHDALSREGMLPFAV